MGSGAWIDGDGPIIKVGDEVVVISKITSERTVTGEFSLLFLYPYAHCSDVPVHSLAATGSQIKIN